MTTLDQRALIRSILKEAEGFSQQNILQNALAEGKDLKNFPLQPLYVALRAMPLEEMAVALPLLSASQRRALLDIDLWSKDKIDVASFERSMMAYGQHPDDKLRYEFARGPEFALFFKARFNVWTFDAEDPQYPDHDNYFLTDDNLLLVEFDQDCPCSDHVRQIIRDLYLELGVENAYAYLFKIVSEGHLSLMEQEFQLKKGRLEDYGFVDYYDALELKAIMPSVAYVDQFIRKKIGHTPALERAAILETLHEKAVTSFADHCGDLDSELLKLDDQKRFQFLRFNFVRLINATLVLDDGLKKGSVAMARVGRVTKERVLFGLNYVKELLEREEGPLGEASIFARFDYIDFYKVGHSLIALGQRELRKYLRAQGLENSPFLGGFWEEFIEAALSERPRSHLSKGHDGEQMVQNLSSYMIWKNWMAFFGQWAPLIQNFEKTFRQLASDGVLKDSYYLNYSVTEIDFEAILLGQFANFVLGLKNDGPDKKLGLTLEEYKLFAKMVTEKDQIDRRKVGELVENFARHLKLEENPLLVEYLFLLLQESFEGLKLTELEDRDFVHVGGPLILDGLSS